MTDSFPTNGVPGFKGKRVLVTGGSGLIGSYTVKLLKESGAFVRTTINKRIPNEFTNLADEIVQLDLSNPHSAYVAPFGCEYVMGCAGITGGVGLASLDPLSYVGPATVIAINTLHACVENKVKAFGFLSSTTVYAPSETPVKEEDIQKSDALYPAYRGIGQSKRFLEQLCAYYHEKTGLGVGIVRPAGVYGRFDNFDEKTSHVIPAMVNRALKNLESFEVWGDGNDVRDFVHAQDVARCLLLSVANLPDATPINAASGKGITTSQLAEHVLKCAGSKARIVLSPEKLSTLKLRLVDVTKAKEKLGFQAEISIEDGIKDTVEYLRRTLS